MLGLALVLLALHPQGHAHEPAAAAPAVAEAPRIEVEGGEALVLDAALLARLPRRSVAVAETHHVKAGTFEGVSLRDLLTEAKVPAGDAVRGKLVSWIVTVDAADGYRAVFSLAEVEPSFAEKLVLVADTRDGRPLAADEGPLRLVVPDENRPARWVRQVTRISVGPALP